MKKELLKRENPWPIEADGFNAYLEKVNENTFGNDAINWQAVSRRIDSATLSVNDEEIFNLRMLRKKIPKYLLLI